MAMKKKIGVVTVLYNSSSVIEDFLISLNCQIYKNFILYVVDNHSTDDVLFKVNSLMKSLVFNVVIIAECENWGVAKGNNIGIKRALADNCDYVLLSNNDTVLQPTTLENLLKGLEMKDVKLAVPKIYFYQSNLLNFAGGDFCFYNASGRIHGYGKMDSLKYNLSYICTYAPTCFMLIDRDVFEHVGFMDENYFVYFDDTDFVYRALKKRYEIAYIPDSTIEHKESVCTGGVLSDFYIKYYFRNMVYFSLKHHCIFQQIVVLGYAYLKLVFHLLTRWRMNRTRKIFSAMNDGFKFYNQINY